MKIQITLEIDEAEIIREILKEIIGANIPNDLLYKILVSLPNGIIGLAVSYGVNDTVFRDNLYEYLEREKKSGSLAEFIKKYHDDKNKSNIKICDNCGYSVDITTNKGHKPYCQFIFGRRGWRQLGIYDS